MANKNTVTITARGKGNTTVAVGGSMGRAPVNSDSENKVRVNIDGQNLITTAVGGNVGQSALPELRDLLVSSLQKKNEQDDASDIVAQLDEQANKPAEERNETKIKRLLDSLGSYVNLVSIAVVNVEKIKSLYEQTIKFFGF